MRALDPKSACRNNGATRFAEIVLAPAGVSLPLLFVLPAFLLIASLWRYLKGKKAGVSMNSRMRVLSVLAMIFALGMVLSGCSSGSTPITITLSPSGAQNAVAGQAVNITATVAADSKTGGVTWTLSGPGTLSGQTATAVTYTAPSPVTANGTATITATSVSDPTKTTVLTINLQAVSIALTPSAAQTDEQGQTTNVTAAVSNDPMTKGVTWSLTGAGALSGQTATAVKYTAPASVTTASTATITATSVFDATKTATLTINLVPPPSVTTTSLSAGTVGTAYSSTLAATNGVTPYTWSIKAGSLPAGLSLAASTGAITGTPTANGTSNFTVQVLDANAFTAIAALSIKINPAPVAITTTSLPNGIANSPGYSATLTSTGGAAPITWSWTAQSGSTLPPGLVLNPGTGVISGTATSAGTFNVSVTATDSSAPALTASKNLSITIIPQLVINTSSPLPNGITNTAYNSTLTSVGGAGTVTWSITTGSLPTGLTLAAAGTISGTPTAAGTFNLTLQAADSGTPQQKVTKAFTITIIQQLAITTSAALPTGSVTTPYSVTLASSGGTGAVTWAVTGGSTLPGGLTLTSAGVLAGTPTTANTYHFSITATDSGAPPQTATVAFTLIITPKLAITTTSLPSGTVNTAYSTPVQSNNGGIAPIAWSVVVGSLPPGLSLNASTGVISGTPTTATGSPFNFTVRAADSGTPQQTTTQALSISIATAPLSVATTGLPNGVVGQSYTGAMLQSAGGNPPVTWSISAGTLPSWATLNASTGAITGTPTAAGATMFTVKATDSSTPTPQTATKQLSIQVNSVLTITTTSLPNGTVGTAYNTTLQSSGGGAPVTWAISVGSLPSWASLDTNTGAITGTPNASGTTNFTVRATDSTSPTPQVVSQALSITVTVATLTVTTTSLPNGTVNSAYNQQLSFNGGTPPITWSISGGALPAWASLNASTGAITGTPNATGTTSFTVKATDSATPTPQTATQALSITVNAAAACTTGGSESMLNGSYAFLLKGFDSSSNPVLIGGVLTFNGTGTITAGAIDINQNSGFTSNALTSGSYHITSDQRGCMVITTSAGTQNYRFSLGNFTSGVASTGRVIGFDTAGPFTTGLMRKQSGGPFSNASANGSFAFGGSSIQNSAAAVGGGKFGVVGVITFDGSGGITGGSEDINQNGTLDGSSANTTWPTSPISITNVGSSYSIAANGRGTLTVALIGTSAIFHQVLYVVSSNEALFMASDAQATNNIAAGEALKQSGTPFSANPLSGTYVGYQSGTNSATAGPSRASILLITISGNNISGTQLRSDGTNFNSQSISATYSVAPSGRMTIPASGGNNNPPIFYLVSLNQAFVLGSGSSVEAGFFQSQTGSPFSSTSASGSYAFGTVDPGFPLVNDNEGQAVFTSPNVTVTVDANNNGLQNLGKVQGPFSYGIDSTGLGTIPSGCSITASSTTCNVVFYVISPTKLAVLDGLGSTTPDIQPADQ
jgi:hypothetical protein